MRDIDETDRQLLRLLLEDGRRSYSDLADAVGLSPPAVSDRVDRLREIGVIERFTVDLDRSRLRGGARLAVTLAAAPGETGAVREALSAVDGVEAVYATADGRLFAVVTVPDGDVESFLDPVLGPGDVADVDVAPLVAADQYPSLGEATLGLECAECGNTVTGEGVSAAIGGERYDFCCGSCEARFRERYESLEEGA